MDEASTKELEGIVGVQRLQIQKALKENMASEEALKEFEIELENKYRKNLASQVTNNCSVCLDPVKLPCATKSSKKKKVFSSTNFLLSSVVDISYIRNKFKKKKF